MRFLVLALLFILGASAPALSKAPVQTDWVSVIARTPEGGARMGNPNAPLKLVEYGSRSCPVCGRFAYDSVTAGSLRDKYVASGKVSYEFRDVLIHPQDLGATVIGQCVSDRNYFVILDTMYEMQNALNARADAIPKARFEQLNKMQPLPRARAWSDWTGYTDIVRKAGMPEARINACFSNPQTIPILARRLEGGAKAGVQGTPTFFLNGKRIDGVRWSDVEVQLIGAGG